MYANERKFYSGRIFLTLKSDSIPQHAITVSASKEYNKTELPLNQKPA